jgi:hypothetical protein
MAIDILGTIAARLKRDAVICSREKFWVLQTYLVRMLLLVIIQKIHVVSVWVEGLKICSYVPAAVGFFMLTAWT